MTPAEALKRAFSYSPTPSQEQLFHHLEKFIIEKNKKSTLLIKGYAGTGKTSIVGTLVNLLYKFDYKYVLLAPTGRAAKVMSQYSKKNAYTIHKKIFYHTADQSAGTIKYKRQKNYYHNTIFIVDEASMIYDQSDFGSKGLLTELIEYAFENESNKLILIGDGAQLPPVKQDISPALDTSYLLKNFEVNLIESHLLEVTRQDLTSGILLNATNIRDQLNKKDMNIHLTTQDKHDVYRMSGNKMEDGLRYVYDKYGTKNCMVICQSNKAATQYNQFIRRNILFSEDEIDAGDFMMVVKNNYFYTPEDSPQGFIANGDFVEITKIISFENEYNLRFANLELRLLDDLKEERFEAKVILDTITAPTPALDPDKSKSLYQQVSNEFSEIKNKSERQQMIKKSPYLNALQIKFAYAITCHKAQGGQWDAVFVDQGYLKEENENLNFLRWLYTAVTRATKELFFVNFDKKFF